VSDDNSLSLLLTGDSLITRRVSRAGGARAAGLRERIQAADVAFTNLESIPNDFVGYPVQESGGDHLAADSWVIDELVAMGLDLFATAHNHSLDYGVEGVLATIERLDARGVAHAGLGRNLGEARMPAFYETPRGAVALLSCSSSFGKGYQAGEQRPDMQGRPGLNPLRTTTTYVVSAEELEQLRAIATRLGLEQRRLDRLAFGFGSPTKDDVWTLGDMRFRAGDEPAIEQTMDDRDLEALASWVRDARLRAAWVVVSLHAHEQGADKEDPAGFMPDFARRMIDEGADVVVGHGPHLLRGMELYKGKPIFYSLGNFIEQHDLVYKHPADAYQRFGIDPALTPGMLAHQRDDGGTKGFAADPRYWRTVVPTCHFDGGTLTRIEILPVSLGFGQPMHARGVPRLATGDEAATILNDFARLSEPFDTRLDIDGERATVRLA
jgi:poly-gamma-glutamate synthesis protein (capsule biosynthesis protein)